MKLRFEIEFPDEVSEGAIDAYCAGVKRIAEAMFQLPVKIERGERDEPIRGVDPRRNRRGDNPWTALPFLHLNNVHSSGEGETVVRDLVRPGDRRRFHGVARVDGPPGPESGSDRLSGPPEGIPAEKGKHMAGLHRGRRRRLWKALKKVGAGRRFAR